MTHLTRMRKITHLRLKITKKFWFSNMCKTFDADPCPDLDRHQHDNPRCRYTALLLNITGHFLLGAERDNPVRDLQAGPGDGGEPGSSGVTHPCLQGTHQPGQELG
jgi:hypothetical protein